MPLTFILNGYFRSGTTVMYKLIKDSNPDKIVFYEPLHDKLFSFLGNHKIGQIDKAHNMCLWDEYFLQGEEFIDTLRERHPCTGQLFSIDSLKVINYLDIFHNLPKDVILQPNRMHFVLGKIAQHYKIPCTHMIRNFLDSYLDIINTYRQKRSKEVVFIADILRKFNLLPLKKAFAADKGLEFIFEYFGKPPKWADIAFKIAHYNDTLGIYLVNWTITNYVAIKQLEKYGGFLLIYEDLVSNPSKVFDELGQISGLGFKKEFANMISKKFTYKYDSQLVKRLKDKIREYQIEPEYNYVMERANYRF